MKRPLEKWYFIIFFGMEKVLPLHNFIPRHLFIESLAKYVLSDLKTVIKLYNILNFNSKFD